MTTQSVHVVGGYPWHRDQFRHPSGDPLPLNKTITIKGNQWNPHTYSFNVTQAAAGLYFVGLSVGVPRSTQANYILHKSRRRFGGITRSSDVENNVNVMSRDFLIPLYAADTLHVSSEHEVYSWNHQQDTSLSIFSLSHTMVDDTTAFCVARCDTICGFTKPVPFNSFLYNSGQHYNPLNHTYTAPTDGVYYFSFSVGVNAHSKAEFVLYKNGKAYVNIIRKSTTHNGTDMIRRAVMVHLDKNDQIYMVNGDGQTARSSPMLETSFSGFKYQPTHGNMVHDRNC